MDWTQLGVAIINKLPEILTALGGLLIGLHMRQPGYMSPKDQSSQSHPK